MHSLITMVCVCLVLFFPGHVSKPAFDIWQHHQLKNKNQINQRLTKNIIHQNWTKKLRHSEIHLDSFLDINVPF